MLTLVVLAAMVIYKQQYHASYSNKRRLLDANKEQISCLIAGSSHTYQGINPALFPIKTINIAEVNKPIQIDIEIIEKYINQLPNLKYVIIPIDYFTFYFSGLSELFSPRYYHHWNLKEGYINAFYLKRLHVFTCGFSLTEYDKNVDQTPLGYWPHYENLASLTEDLKNTNCKIRLDAWNRFWIDTSNTSFIYKRILDLTALLAKKKIEPIFVTMPVCSKFYNYFDSSLLSKNALLLNQIIAITRAKYINLQNNPVFKSDSLFADIDHLNDKGATIATNIIKDLLN